MKRLLLAPLLITLLLSSCGIYSKRDKQYLSELDLAVEQIKLITNMVNDYKQRGITFKYQNNPVAGKEMIKRAIDLTYKARDLKDYSICIKDKMTEKIIFEIGKSECFVETGVDLSTTKWLFK